MEKLAVPNPKSQLNRNLKFSFLLSIMGLSVVLLKVWGFVLDCPFFFGLLIFDHYGLLFLPVDKACKKIPHLSTIPREIAEFPNQFHFWEPFTLLGLAIYLQRLFILSRFYIGGWFL